MSDFPAPQRSRPQGWIGARTIVALMLREMSSQHGRSALGYLWAILEPVAGIMLMAIIFSLGFRSPPLGTNFALFFATGVLPFMAYQDTSARLTVALRFSKQLLFYPRVTFFDALMARFLVAVITNIMVSAVLLPVMILIYDLDVILHVPTIALAYVMAFALAAGVGTLNCYMASQFPNWERTWAILNRPLFIVSCIIFLFDVVPQPYRDWLWWNPLIHCVGLVREGVYATYSASYASPIYVFAVSAITLLLGLILLSRYHRDIANS